MSVDRNAEIWSTRLQKELLALTTDNASDNETQEVAGVLPPFIRVKSHHLDINEGVCTVSFVIDVPSPEKEEEAGTDPEEIVLVINASIPRNADGVCDGTAGAYPFRKPEALLEAGEGRFPPGSTIQNGSGLEIDCDWTPSLHLTDAVLNVGLKVKESLLQKEPLHGLPAVGKSDFDEILQSARRFGSFLGKSAKSIIQEKPKTELVKKSKKKSAANAQKTDSSDIKIGDEINLLEEPWVTCQGLYSCKAIRRPAFVEDAIFLAAQEKEISKPQVSSTLEGDDEDVPDDFGNFVKLQTGVMSKVAGAGLSGAGAMFRSLTQSAKSVLEESFLMITDTHIIELRSSKLNLSVGTVTIAISIDLMAKLKFRRQESISLFFKPASDDPLIYMCPDSAAAVNQIQTVLKTHGVKGKHTNAATQKNINDALQLVQEIQAKERALEYQPSSERVSEIMDLYRQAAELFESAGDIRHEEVVLHLRKFLALPLTASILDGSFKPESSPAKQQGNVDGPIPEGEVLERTKEQLEADDDSVGRAERNADDDFTKNIDSVLKEAQQDLDNINDGLDDDFDGGGDAELDDLDAMLAAADADLADLMAS